MLWLVPSVIASLVGTFVLTAVYVYLYSQDRKRFLLIWAFSWAVYMLRFCFMLAMSFLRETPFLTAGYHLTALVSGVLLLWGAHVFIGRPLARGWLIGAAAIAVWLVFSVARGMSFLALTIPNFLFLACIYIWTGVVFLRTRSGAGSRIVGWGFVLWGVHKADYPFLRAVVWFAPWGYLISSVFELSIAIGMLLIYFQKMRMELVEKEKRFRGFLENIHFAAVMLDTAGTVLFCNDYLLSMSRRSRDELIGKNWFELMIPADLRAEVREYFENVISGKYLNLSHENAVLTSTGERRLVVWDNIPIRNSNGKIVGTASIGTDVTEQRKIQEQLRQAQKMEAVGQLAGGIAHDFNNILTAIVGYAHLIKMNAKPDDPQLLNVDSILEAAQRAAVLTHSLLAFSRKQVITIRPVDLNTVIKRMEKLLLRLITEDIEMKTELIECPLMALADAGQIEQVLMNLVANARDAMPAGGRLTIRSARSTIDKAFIDVHGYGEPGNYAMISVSDTGIGMDERTREKIFEPFFTTKEPGRGTGLGLAMVYGIVKQHNGFITVQSEAGKGTTFEIYLPLSSKAVGGETHPIQKEEERALRGSETVLIAEDDDALRRLSATVLKEYGYRVIEAADGEEAIQKFAEHRADVRLVVLDVIMPKKNGREAHDEIKKLRPDVRAIFISGYPSDIITQKGVLNKDAELILKPISPMDFLKRVRRALDR